MKREVIDAVDNLAKVFSTLTQDEQIEAIHSLSFLKAIYEFAKNDMIQDIKKDMNDGTFSLYDYVNFISDEGYCCEKIEDKEGFFNYLKGL